MHKIKRIMNIMNTKTYRTIIKPNRAIWKQSMERGNTHAKVKLWNNKNERQWSRVKI